MREKKKKEGDEDSLMAKIEQKNSMKLCRWLAPTLQYQQLWNMHWHQLVVVPACAY